MLMKENNDTLSNVLLDLRADWYSHANCTKMGDMFFDPDKEEECKSICESCSVRLDCLNSAIIFQDEGIRGGLNSTERQQIIRRQKRYSRLFKLDVFGLDVLNGSM
jgi:hypothetical protein